MKKNFRHLILSVAAVMALSGCQEKLRNTEELVDPWLRERTPVNVRLERQIGPAIISSDWRTDSLGTVNVSLVVPELDMSAVKVVALDFAYPESEFCPTASLKPGDLIDLSDGSEEFTVTSSNGETRTYTITYTNFKDQFEGCYSFTPVGKLMSDATHSRVCSSVMIGGFEKYIVYCNVTDKYWKFPSYKKNPDDPNSDAFAPEWEDDNTLSFRLDRVDEVTGETFGTVVNECGPDGRYADYLFTDAGTTFDINEQYRLIPAGKSRWAKHREGYVTIYAYEDESYSTPLHELELLTGDDERYYQKEAGALVFWPEATNDKGESAAVHVTFPSLALHRSFGEGPFTNQTSNWENQRWYVHNIRNIFWLIQKDTDEAHPNHSDWLKE